MADSEEKTDVLGQFLTEVLKNRPLFWFEKKMDGEGASSQDQIAHRYLSQLPEETREVIFDAVNDVVTNSVYDFLEKLQELWEDDGRISLLVDGENIFDLDDEVKMRLFGEASWDVKFGRFLSSDALTDKYDERHKKLRREGLADS